MKACPSIQWSLIKPFWANEAEWLTHQNDIEQRPLNTFSGTAHSLLRIYSIGF